MSDRGPEHPPAQDTDAPTPHPRRLELHRVIFGTDTPAGRAFDVALIALVLASLVVVSMETVRGLQPASYRALRSVTGWRGDEAPCAPTPAGAVGREEIGRASCRERV